MKAIYKGFGFLFTDGSGHFSGIDLDGIERKSAQCTRARVRVTIRRVRVLTARQKQIIRDATMAIIGASVAVLALYLMF